MKWLPKAYRVVPKATVSVWMWDSVFSPDALHALLHTELSATAHGARTSSRSSRAFSLVDLVVKAIELNETGRPMGGADRFVDVTCILPRERHTRWDVRLTDHWVEKMREVNVAFHRACDMVDHLRRNDGRCARAKVDWHLQQVLPGSPDQELHIDDRTHGSARRCFYTFIVPLTDNPSAGGTFFPKLGKVFSAYGGALCFDGTVEHAGLGNRSQQTRHFLYAAIYTGRDENCA